MFGKKFIRHVALAGVLASFAAHADHNDGYGRDNRTRVMLRQALDNLYQARSALYSYNTRVASDLIGRANGALRMSGAIGDYDISYAVQETQRAMDYLRDWRMPNRDQIHFAGQSVNNAIDAIQRARCYNDGYDPYPRPLPPRPLPPRPHGQWVCNAHGLMHPGRLIQGYPQFNRGAAEASALSMCRSQHRVCVIQGCWNTY